MNTYTIHLGVEPIGLEADFDLPPGQCLRVGSSEKMEIPLPDSGLEPYHLSIERREDGRVYVEFFGEGKVVKGGTGAGVPLELPAKFEAGSLRFRLLGESTVETKSNLLPIPPNPEVGRSNVGTTAPAGQEVSIAAPPANTVQQEPVSREMEAGNQSPGNKAALVLSYFNRATNVNPILESLSSGKIVRNAIGAIIQAYSVLIGIGLLLIWVDCFSGLGDINFFQGMALLLWQIFFPYAAFLCIKIVFNRGAEIRKLPDSEFVVSPIIATFITLHGEIVFIFLAIMSVPAMLLTWLGLGLISDIIPIPLDEGFLTGILIFIAFWIAGFLFYAITRWIREWTMAIFSIAKNVDLINGRGEELPVSEAEDL